MSRPHIYKVFPPTPSPSPQPPPPLLEAYPIRTRTKSISNSIRLLNKFDLQLHVRQSPRLSRRMAPRSKDPYMEGFEYLSAQGFDLKRIENDGNCLFRALSDQLHGNPDEHSEVRAGIIKEMRRDAAYYKQFITVDGERRSSRRAASTQSRSQLTEEQVTAEAIDKKFESHLKEIAEDHAWGTEFEIKAFARHYKVDIRLYKKHGRTELYRSGDDQAQRRVVRIAYHEFRHYSSVRATQGFRSIEERRLARKALRLQRSQRSRKNKQAEWEEGVKAMKL